MIDLSIRAETHKKAIASAIAMGIVEIDEETKQPVAKTGVNIVTLPPIVKTKGTYDKSGKELTAPAFYSQSHYNIRITDEKIAKTAQRFIDDAFKENIKGSKHKAERSFVWKGVELLDNIETPVNRWL